MSKYNNFEDETLKLIFTNTDFFLYTVGDASSIRGSVTAGNFYIALFTGDPAEDQSGVAGNECNYTSYARVAVPRTTSYWTITSGICTNDAAITFPACTGGTETATYFGICTAGTKTVSDLVFYGALTGGGLAISTGVTPQIQADSLSITEG